MENIINKELPWKNLQLEDLDGEDWVDIINYDGIYQCSNFGRIKSLGRFVNVSKGGQRWAKERIRKQFLSNKDNRLMVTFSGKTLNIQAAIFLSFYPKSDYNPKVNCVMHKNKISFDNRLENLELRLITDSHRINFQKGLLPHLSLNNSKKIEKYNSLVNRVCKICNKEKEIKKFRRGVHTCKNCQYLKSSYSSKFGRIKSIEIELKNLQTNEILFFPNIQTLRQSGIIAGSTFRKLLKTEQKIFKSFKKKCQFEILTIKNR